MQMQNVSHKSGDYARPNQNWRCGREDCCQLGPTVDGQCGDDENPCIPKRSVKSKKRIAAIWLSIVMIGIMAIFLSASALLSRVSPGPVSASHTEVAGCQDCHSVANSKISTWLKASVVNFFNDDPSSSHSDDQQCLSCHALGENAFLAHSTSPNNFSSSAALDGTIASSELTWKLSIASKLREMQKDGYDEESCATCHREHKGELNPRVNFDAQKCHTCHQVKFNELDVGHPEYTNFPHTKATHIQFDHASHLEKHFYEDDYFDRAPEGCQQCHQTDQTGEWMLTNSFEETCSSCHLDDILGMNRATAKGIAVLAIPELDVQSLQDAGYNVGEWPAWADGELTPFMRVLMPRALKESSLFQAEKIVLYDLSNADDQQLEAAAMLAWEIKRLFYELLVGGTAVLDQRLSLVMGNTIDKSTINRLVAALPKDTLLNNQQEWFPSLMQEIVDYQDGKIEFRTGVKVEKVDDQALSVESTKSTADIDTSDILGGDTSDILSDDDSDILSDDDSDILSDDDSDILSDDDSDILSDDDSDILSDDDSDILSDDDSDILSDDDSDILSDDDSIALNDDDTVSPLDADQNITLEEVGSDEDWAVSGGWYRDGSSIRYRPTDHADLFFKTWLDVSAAQYDTLDRSLFESLSADKSVGNCTKCHTIQTNIPEKPIGESEYTDVEETTYEMHWMSFKPSDIKVDFNRFSHVSHFSLMTDDGCSSCHVVNSQAEADSGIESEVNGISNVSVSGFLNMPRSTCTQCHQEGRAPDNCLTCHNYHAEPNLQSIELMPDTLKELQ